MAASPKLSILTSIYRGEEYLADFLAQVAAQSIFPQVELVAVLNAGSDAERGLLDQFGQQHPGQLQLIEVEEVETLGASWNRGWRSARGDYLAIWNIDDRREPDSLGRQMAVLEAHPEWAMCYGDFLIVSRYGDEVGRRRFTPLFSQSHFQRAFPQDGAFWLLREDVANEAGYFDEQFKVGADFDYSIRLTIAGLQMGRVEGLLGYFTDIGRGLSTSAGARESAIDRTAVQLRYGIFDKVDPALRNPAARYDIDKVLVLDVWQPLENYLPGITRRRRLLAPLRILAIIRFSIRKLLKRMGLLAPLHRFIEHTLKRDI